MKKIVHILIALALLSLSVTAYLIFSDAHVPINETYVSCGCGECEGTEPTAVVYLYVSEGGTEELARLKERDKDLQQGTACLTMGCSVCTEYRLVART